MQSRGLLGPLRNLLVRRPRTLPEPELTERNEDRASPRPPSHHDHTDNGFLPIPHRASTESYPHRKLAAAVVAGCVEILKEPKPKSDQAITQWKSRRRDEAAFITNARASAFWCEAAGVEWDVVVSQLRAKRWLAA